MEAILFCGIQATGKTTYYKNQFLKTHVLISMDVLNTRNKENMFLQLCIKIQQRFVVDNTNLTAEERKKYIDIAKASKFKVVGYYFHSTVDAALQRNAGRYGKENVPEKGVKGAFKKLEQPTFKEGFDELYCVEITDSTFTVNKWQNEV